MKSKKEIIQSWMKNEEQHFLEKEFTFKSYLKNISFVNAIAFYANKLNHHPDLKISFNKCTVRITTHDAGHTITEKDIQLAQIIDELISDV